MAMDPLCSMPFAPDFDRSITAAPANDDELAVIDRDIAAEAERISHQAALIALLEAAGECTILADAQMGAMEQCLSALWVRRELILASLADDRSQLTA